MGAENLNQQYSPRAETPDALQVMVNTYRWAKLSSMQGPIGQLASQQGWQPEARRTQ